MERILKEYVARTMGLEVVPHFVEELSEERLNWILTHDSFLGGCKIEGIVIKNYTQFGPDKKVLMGKMVSKEFKEIHGKEWKRMNPTQGDIISQLGERYRAEGRWSKAIHRLRDSGELDHSVKDIGPLIKEIPLDIKKECEEEIKELLFKWAWPKVYRLTLRGFPEFYKKYLLRP
jgi:hypothetical protein